MKRRLLSILWFFVVLLSAPAWVRAHDFEAINSYGDTLYYNVLTDTTCALTYKGTSSYSFDEYRDTLIVPSSVINEVDGLTRKVTHLGYNAFRQSSVKHLVLPEGLTTINGAIAGADSLRYIYVPSTLTTIQDGYLTSDLTNLEVLEWNASQYVNTTGKSLFQNTTTTSTYVGLRKIIFGSDVVMIPANFCRSLISLNTVVLPSNVAVIGNDAFYGCNYLYEIYNQSMIPLEVGSSNYGEIARNAKVIHNSPDEPSIFSYQPEWYLYLLDDELHVFRYMGRSYEVSMPQSFIFQNEEYRRYSIDGGTFNGGWASSRVASLVLPDSLLALYGNALSSTRITSIRVPRALERVYPGAFPSSLTSVVWDAVECMNPAWFGGWGTIPFENQSILPDNLTSITLSQDVKSIPSCFLKGNSQIYSFSFPSGLEEIGNEAFCDCSSLVGVLSLPANLRKIGISAFEDCTGFYGSLTLPDQLEVIENKAFKNTNFTGTLTIPESVDTIGNCAFENSKFSVLHYNTQNSVIKQDGSSAGTPFRGCNQLTAVVFGNRVKVIPDYLCVNLTSISQPIVLPDSVKRIGNAAFLNAGVGVGDTLVFPEQLNYVGTNAINIDNLDLLIVKSKKLNLSVSDRRPYNPNWNSGGLKAAIHLASSIEFFPKDLVGEDDLVDSIYYDIPYPLPVAGDEETSWSDEGGTSHTRYEYTPYQFSSSWGSISKIGVGPSVRDISSNLFEQLSNVEQVVIPETVESVGCDAFSPNAEIVSIKPYGQTIRLDGTSVDTWQNVYVYVESVDHFVQSDEQSGRVPAKPFGERPGRLITSPYEYSFPIRYCNGVKIEFSNGTDKSDLVLLPLEQDTVSCRLLSQSGTSIPIMFEASDDMVPEPTDNRIILDENGYIEMFRNTMGDFTEFFALNPNSLSNVWITNSHCVKASSYQNGNYLTEVWLVSPEFDCSNVEHLYLSFEHALGYMSSVTDISDYLGVKVTTDGITWTDVPITTYPAWGENANWWTYILCKMDLNQYMSESTRFAFVYRSDTQNAVTWEVKNLLISTYEQHSPDENFGSMQVPIGKTTKLSDLFYDVDGDSIMEYVYLNNDDNKMQLYTYTGVLKEEFNIPADMRLTAIDDIDRDGVTDFIMYRYDYDADDHLQVYIMSYDTQDIRPLSDAKYNGYNVLFDANGDGRLDYYMDYYTNESSGEILNSTVADYIYIQQPDGSFVRTSIEVITDEDEVINESFAQSGANVVLPPPVHFGGASLAKAPRPRKVDGLQKAAQAGTPMYSSNAPLTVDVNRDGMPDLLNLYNDNSLISLGEGRYYYGTLFGQVTVGDYNSDGIQDFIIFDPTTKTVYLYLYEGDNIYAKQILMQNMNISKVDAVDIDGDGDFDIVLAFDWTEESQYAMLVIYRNDEGVFTKYEYAFGLNRKIHFFDMADVDGDGKYEMVCGEGGGYAPNNLAAAKYFLAECTSAFTVEEEEPFYYYQTDVLDRTDPWPEVVPDIIMGDMNNDGITEYWISNMHYVNNYFNGGTIEWSGLLPYCGKFDREAANVSPEKMNTPTSILDAASGMLKVEWQAGSDAESSACDLTYSVRVGSQPGLSDVMHGQATASGSRLRLGKGNVGTDLFTIFDIRNWSKGTYYIAVQAIDKEGLAGPWSDELVFEHNMLYAAFEMDHSRLFTADTLTLKLSVPHDPTLSYDWTLGENSTIVEESNGTWKVLFSRAEELDIQLRVSASDGSYADAVSRHLVVMPLSWKEDYNESLDGTFNSSGTYFDVDLNGTLDVLGSVNMSGANTNGLHTNDGNNRFTKVPRSFNLDLAPGYTRLIDYNMDGFADFYSTSSKGDLFINSGNNNDFTYSTIGLRFINDWNNNAGYLVNMQTVIDINRDGYPDMIDKYGDFWVNAGDNLTFNEYELPSLPGDQWYTVADWYDWDSDGWLDAIIITSNNQQNPVLYWFRNLANGDFATAQQLCQLPYEASLLSIADLDGDGYTDIAYSMAVDESSHLSVLWGNADGTYTETNYDYKISNNYSVVGEALKVDMDNNGYLDIVLPGNVLYQQENRSFIHVNTTDDKYIAEDLKVAYLPFADLNGDTRPDRGSYVMSASITNTAPMAPANVKAVQDGGYVVLSWDDAYDAETPYHFMRYNVSVKKAGVSGAGSYIISPMNGGSDIAAIAPSLYYYTTNRLEIPANRFTVGESYEVKVQSIDGWNAHSPFSEPFTIVIASEVSISAPMEACTGATVSATYSGTETGMPQWNSEGAAVVADGINADFTWTTPGVKTIECTVNGITSTRAITVLEGVDLSFELPSRVLSSAYVYFTLPEAFSDSRNYITYRHSYDSQQEAVPFVQSWRGTSMPVINTNENGIKIERRGSSLDARMTANVPDGDYWIEFVCQTESCGEITYRQYFTVDGDNVTPEISIVTIDAATGKNVIIWQRPSNLPNSDLYSSVVIYREEGSTDNFVQLGEATIDAGQFVDMASEPSMRKYRYRIALKTNYGGISTPSAVHSSVHVMLNRGLTAGSVNIIWTPYEGGIIEQYTILRGSSPDNMQPLVTASGYEQSYTDFAVPEGDVYYALSYSNTYDNNWGTMNSASQSVRRAPRTVLRTGRSNAVNANQSTSVTPATSLNIRHVESTLALNQTQQAVHLYAEILPGSATYKTVNWQVTSGNHLAMVSSTGLVTYIGNGANGTVTVQASTIDGTHLSKSVEIPVEGFSETQAVTGVELSTNLYILSPMQNTTVIAAEVVPSNASDKSLTWSITSGSEIVTVSQLGVVTALGVNGSAIIRATANNGVYGEIIIYVQGYGGETDVTATSFTLYATDVLSSTMPVEPMLTPAVQTLYIKANIEPENATTKEFILELLEGGEHVTVANMGTYYIVRVAQPASDGVVKFRGSTLDGSNLTYPFEIVLSGFNTAVEQVYHKEVSVYPVPVKDVVFIDSESPIEQIRIFSSDGREVYSTDEAVTAINLSYLPSGVYHMEIRTSIGQLLNRKIIVQK